MKLSIIIPVYNEEKTLKKIINKLESVDFGALKTEIVLVDDCSNDGSREILKEIAKSKKYQVIFHKKNAGKGRALRTGFKYATGDLITIQDADLEYEPHDFKKLLKQILNGQTDVVYGSRFLGQSFLSNQKWAVPSHYMGNKLLSLVTSILYFRWVTDMETCYKMFTRKAYESVCLHSQRFDFEPEITAKFIKNGFKIIEVPIRYYPRDFSEGKKICWKDGLKAIWYLIKYRFFD